MAFYKSKYTGAEIDQRLAQGTYDDALMRGFDGTKEDFDILLAKLKKTSDLAFGSQQYEDDRLETVNKTVAGAINELHQELQTKPDKKDVIDQGEFQVFKDEIAAKYTTRDEFNEDIKDLNSKISTLNTNLVAEIDQRKEAVKQEREERVQADDQLSERIETLAATMNTELSKKLDSDRLLAGAGIDVREEDGKKIVDISEGTLTKIQYADSEVRRLETAKIPYAYDEKTQSNINIILPEGGSYLGNYGDDNATIAKAAVYDGIKQLEIGSSKVHLNLNSLDKPTIETPDGKENLVVESDIKLIPIEVNFPIRTSGGSDGPEDRVYTQEEILEWFGVADITALRKQIANKGIQYIKYGIMLMGNPYYYRMPIQYAAFESANKIKLVFIGLNTNNDVVSKYEIIINLDGTIIEGNSNIKVTITNIEPKVYDDTQLKSELQQTETGIATANSEIEKLKSGKQSVQDESLQTTDKTIVGAINELLTRVQELETKNTELESKIAALEGTN